MSIKHKLIVCCMQLAVAVAALAQTQIEYYAPNIVRVKKTPEGGAVEHPFQTVIAASKGGAEAGALKVTVDGGVVTFSAPDGTVLLRETGDAVFTPWTANGTEYVKAAQKWSIATDEALYGFGDNQWRELNMRNFNGKLMPRNVGDGLAAFVSVKGWGILWDNTSIINAKSDADGVALESEVGGFVDYYFVFGGSLDGVVAGFRELTGDVTMFPRWAYGFWQSKERYMTQHETFDVVKKYRHLGIPLDGIVQDWQYWGNNYLWNAMEFCSPDFRDPQRMMREIHDKNAKVAITIWQSFGPVTKQYRELEPKGLLFPFETWPQSGLGHIWPPRKDYPSGVRLYDAYSADARDIYWKHLTRLFDLGIDCWWMDSTDPDHMYKEGDFEHKTSLGVPWRAVRSAYPVACTQAVYEHMRQATDKRCFIFTRGAGLGQQRNGSAVWSGDTGSSWDTLRRQIPGGLNFSMTGNPNFNCDLGGFFAGRYRNGGGVDNPNWRELYVRWMQLGTFLPMMRSHGTDLPREIYLYGKQGEPVYDALVCSVKLRYRLMPYLYSVAADAALKRGSFMRPVVADFPADKATWDLAHEFLVGSEILAAPVVTAKYTNEDNKPVGEMEGWNKEGSASAKALADKQGSGVSGQENALDWLATRTHKVYLPAGTDWWQIGQLGIGTGNMHHGGQTVEVAINLLSQPFFVKAGSILPLGPDVQYNGEKVWDNLEICVYPGADGSFSLYEDDFETYAYEKGAFTRIPFTWCDKTRTLTIGAREGAYPEMLKKRTFTVVLPDGTTTSVAYSGDAVKVKL